MCDLRATALSGTGRAHRAWWLCGQGASRVLGPAACSELGLSTPKKADGFAEPPAASWRQCCPGDGGSFSAGDNVSLRCLSGSQGFELMFLPFKDVYLCSSILFCNKASLILCYRQSLPSFV